MGGEISDKDVAQKYREKYQESVDEKSTFPTELFDLPSKGYFYSSDNELSSGQIELKIPTAKEEDILTSKNLIQKGLVIDKFLQSIIKSNIDYNDLLLGDKNGIMYAARMLAYGPEYSVTVNCPKCGETNKDVKINISTLLSKDVDFEKYEKGTNEFEIELPLSKSTVKFKLLTHADEKKVDEEIKSLKKKKIVGDADMTTRLKHAIVEINGEREIRKIREFVDTMPSRDSLTLRTMIADISPDINSQFDFECTSCEYDDVMSIPMEIGFFWPSGRL